MFQVAEQQGKYLARVLNEEAKRHQQQPGVAPGSHGGAPPAPGSHQQTVDFVYKSLGSMATVGGYSGVLELAHVSGWLH